MSLKYAVLAALLEGEASGYELSKVFDVSLANFWPATPQQLYRELERLAQDGLIAARLVRQERRPDKRMFTLTEAGREDLRAFAAAPPRRPTAVRDELLIKIQAMDGVGVDPATTRSQIEERMSWARAKLDRYLRVRERLLAGRTEEEFLGGADRIGPYLTLMAGIAFEEENLRWCERVLAHLRRRTAVG
ncbi:PadR family transcriptional regulator [Streptomyces sp. NPDC101213]|uniref:PadR family transcriptional regulator n=1 Tax=Streptomyces sp. NPDC101213 TaxID=3366130 RepID=UPI00383092EB